MVSSLKGLSASAEGKFESLERSISNKEFQIAVLKEEVDTAADFLLE